MRDSQRQITPSVAGFFDWNYRHKSVAIQIPEDAGWDSMQSIGRKCIPKRGTNQRRFLIRVQSIMF